MAGKVTLTIRKTATVPQPRQDSVVLKVKGYGHPEIIQWFGLDTRLTKPNFNHVDTYDPIGRWSAVTRFQTLSVADYEWLKSIQPNFTREAENWLIGDRTEGPPSRPMWWDEKNGQRVLRCGASVFGENPVLVEARDGRPVEYVFEDTYPTEPGNARKHPIVFFRVIGMKPEDRATATNARHPYWIQRCNQANSSPQENTIDWYPKGVTIFYPVLDYSRWPLNTGFTNAFIARVFFYGYTE